MWGSWRYTPYTRDPAFPAVYGALIVGGRTRERSREFGKWTVRVFRCLVGSHPSGERKRKKAKGESEKKRLFATRECGTMS